MTEAALDHIAIAARGLEEGRIWLEERLGVKLQAGGKHPLLGTHNMLLSLGPREYLELITLDPDAAPLNGPGWFGLQNFEGTPRVVGWVMRQSPIEPRTDTTVTEISRGDLHWRITLPDTGQMPGDGAVPMRIEWADGRHPCDKLPDKGLRLVKLDLRLPMPLELPFSDPRINVTTGKAAMSAKILTSLGEITL